MGGGTSATPLYNEFIDVIIEQIKPRYISMIIPSRWTCGGSSKLDAFRSRMVEGNKLTEIHHYNNANEVFDGVSIAGGVMYFLWDRDKLVKDRDVMVYIKDALDSNVDISRYGYKDNNGKEQYMVILDSVVRGILEKIKRCRSTKRYMNDSILSISPFGLGSNFTDSDSKTLDKNIKVVCSRGRVTYTSKDEISQNRNIIDRYKLVCAKVSPEGGSFNGGRYNVLSKPFIIGKNEVCSMTYLVLLHFDKMNDIKRARRYIATKFVRSLVLITLSSINISSRNYMFVPMQDFSDSSDIHWDVSIEELDKQLYKKYSLTEEEIGYIESTIKPMEIK